MLRQRLVRQSALNISSGSDSMPSPQPVRRRRGSQDCKLYNQLSSESLDKLLGPAEPYQCSNSRGRRHSVACGLLYVDIQKPSLKSALNSALKRMSSACSSASSSTYNLSTDQGIVPNVQKKHEEVLLPQVLGTFLQSRMPQPQNDNSSPPPQQQKTSKFLVNRRFSTDLPPPSYSEATGTWKQHLQKSNRQAKSVVSKEYLIEDNNDSPNYEERLA